MLWEIPKVLSPQKSNSISFDSAQHYLAALDPPVDEWRVDVVAITGRPGNSKIDIQVFQNALYF